jgi:hypothetical protein
MSDDSARAQRAAAAKMGRDVRAGCATWEAFLAAFGDSRDELIADLVDLVEHEPQQGGLLGVSKRVYSEYQASIEQALAVLENDVANALSNNEVNLTKRDVLS